MSQTSDVFDRQSTITSSSTGNVDYLGILPREIKNYSPYERSPKFSNSTSDSVSTKPFKIEFIENTPQAVFNEEVLSRGSLSNEDKDLINRRLSKFSLYKDGWN